MMDSDTAENEQQFAEILPIGRRVAAPLLLSRPRRGAGPRRGAPSKFRLGLT